jgi:hypothetical protein
MTPVDLGDGRSVRVTINRSLPHDPKLLFVNEEQETFLKTLLKRFRADWKSPDLSEKPSAGQPPQILELMREFINVRIQATGDMKRPVLEWDVFTTRPISITFQDELRERAEVCSSDSTGGSCLIYGKRAGAWFFTEEAKMWIIHRDPRGR